ncbi:uncharacterized protein LOC110461902 [Mizuhopecten yessoensis]|uniref:uncharacterized protein LOC110461902 n=1 Tax=Mizuhopecten yessoensis TaxID=6573 RepID=UPI000B45DA09|nr:uncharacterized protein LOC110461902 [Mizuhopecten yessoensis]XP_021371309.1 uncharacterized protein LOC110461902 [Mizuhopecten yessoensis]
MKKIDRYQRSFVQDYAEKENDQFHILDTSENDQFHVLDTSENDQFHELDTSENDQLHVLDTSENAQFHVLDTSENDQCNVLDTSENEQFHVLDTSENDQCNVLDTSENEQFHVLDTSENDQFHELDTSENDQFNVLDTSENDQFNVLDTSENDKFHVLDTSENDQSNVLDTSESDQSNVLDTSENDQSYVQNSCKPKHQIVPVLYVLRHRKEDLIIVNESPKDIVSGMVYMYMLCALLCPNEVYGLFAWKACMKPVCHSLVVKDLDIIRKVCFYKSDQQKYGNKIPGSLSTQLYNQVVQVYAVVNNNYMYGNGVLTQTNTDVLAVSDHESPLQLFNPQQHQHNPAAVEILDGPIQHPQQNDAGVLAIADHELPLQFYNQYQHQNNPAVEDLEGPIQHPAQNCAGVLAIADHEPIANPHNQQQQQNDHWAAVLHAGHIQQLALGIAVVVETIMQMFFIYQVVMATLLQIPFL